MMLSEFEKLTGLEVTTAEYEKIEAEYMESPDDKAKFCKMWLKKGGLQRLHNARLEEIEHLKKTIEDLEHKLDEEQDWQISHMRKSMFISWTMRLLYGCWIFSATILQPS